MFTLDCGKLFRPRPWRRMHLAKYSCLTINMKKKKSSFYVQPIGIWHKYLFISSCSTGRLWNSIQMDDPFCKRLIQHHAIENLPTKAVIAIRVNRRQSADNCWQQEKAKQANKKKTSSFVITKRIFYFLTGGNTLDKRSVVANHSWFKL